MYAFTQVRKEMLCDPNKITSCPQLFETIHNLAVERKIFMTNTPGPTGPEFVRHLSLENLFDTYVYDAKKPEGMKDVMDALLAEGYLPDEILSVGDNPFNDLYPVKKAGGRTCLISQYAHAETVMWDHAVKTVEELSGFLGKLQAVHL
jgi:FMN phosphatase YigB (HAD superfamily)